MRRSLSGLLSTKSTNVFLPDDFVVNKNAQMVDSKQNQSVQDQWNFLLSLMDKERKDVAKVKGIGQANITNWLDRGRFTAAGFLKLERWARQQGVTGLTLEWLNTGKGAPPEIAETSHEITATGTVVKLHPSISDLSPQVVNGDYAMFPRLWGEPGKDSPYIYILSHLLRHDPALLQDSVQAFINPTDTMRGVIEKGDLVFVQTSVRNVALEKLVDGIYVYKFGEVAYIRRIQNRGKGGLRLSGTHAYEDSQEFAWSELDDFEIGGLVIGRLQPPERF